MVYPAARATAPVLSTAIAIVVLNEKLNFQLAAGGAAVILGVVFLTGGMKRDGKNVTTSVLFGLGAGTLISSYTV